MKRFFKGFAYAGRGIFEAMKERNFRFHLCAAALVISFGIKFYSFRPAEWAVLLLTIMSVLALETVNTAIEKLADKVCKENDVLIRKCKDCAAGAVLIGAIFAVAVGVVLFWNTERLGLMVQYFSEPARLAILIMVLALFWGFIFLPKTKEDREKANEKNPEEQQGQ